MTEVELLVQRLKYYNNWRRNGNCEQPDPTEIGRDIDKAINLIERWSKQLKITQ